MKPRESITRLLFVAATLIQSIWAIEIALDQNYNIKCSGMYSRKSWGGPTDPYILVKYVQDKSENGPEDPISSLIIFEWSDNALIGAPTGQGDEKKDICDQAAVDANLCTDQHIGEFILTDNATDISRNEINTKAIHLKDPKATNYHIAKTGYYCVGAYPYQPDTEFKAIVEFRNAFGELPAAQIAKLPFYGGLTIVYFVLSVFWGFLYFQNRSDILPVQNYITAILVFLVIEMLMTWGFYDYQNRHGNNAGAKALMVVVSVLNAARNSFSFFLLLIVCMGYGVVKPTLGKTMIYVRWLAAAHLVFGIIYAVASLTVQPDDAGPLILLVILPLSATLTAFYIWTLNSLNYTIKDLVERKQHVKAGMYKSLWYCILISILVIFGFFFFNSFAFASAGREDFAPMHWQTRWFVLDGWLNIVYLGDITFVAWVWRPTPNNRRFAMSEEIAQDDEGFELGPDRDSLDIEESGASSPNNPPAYDSVPRAATNAGLSAGQNGNANRDRSPLPAPRPQKPMTPLSESLDGDTIFAVGEDKDDFSDEDGDGDERKRLTGKDD